MPLDVTDLTTPPESERGGLDDDDDDGSDGFDAAVVDGEAALPGDAPVNPQ